MTQKNKDKKKVEDFKNKEMINNNEEQNPVDDLDQNDQDIDNETETQTTDDMLKQKIEDMQSQLNELNDKYLRLYSEYDNYRKRTVKEKHELFKTAASDILFSLLPVLDDFNHASKVINDAQDIDSLKEGFNLIQNKFKDFLTSKGVEEINSINETFDTDLHEAITNIPAPSEDMKGKIIDEVQKGYKLNGKVIRYAKVVVGN
ncbi:MAG: nucleotide exchange factor GrpE [Bacteroidota bacterium]|nr:nucleotide exchange factor GrpE [Bacteroidota bacterium]